MLIKKVFWFVFTLILAFFCAGFSCFAVSVSAKSAVVLDARSNEILFESNAFEKRSMASTTKIMTAILAIESGRLEETVDVAAAMTKAEGTSIGLKSGYRLKLLDLVYGMMLESGNDAANAVALYLSGSFEAFSALMNKKAAEIGMESTNFVTPSGLDDDEHYSTAYDMALLASYCIKNPVFCSVCSDKSYVAHLIEPASCRLYFSNHNRLLSSVDGVFGVKTGFTKKSGRCLVSAIKKDGAVLVAVTLKAPDDWNDHKKLFAACLKEYEKIDSAVAFPNSVSVMGGKAKSVSVLSDKDFPDIAVKKGTECEKAVRLPTFIYAPVKSGDVIGEIEYSVGGKVIDTVCLTAGEAVFRADETHTPKKSIIKRFAERLKSLFAFT